MTTERELRVKPIVNGTVIDHISAGQALNVLKILGITSHTKSVVSVLMNVPSGHMGAKDVVKVEDRELDPEEVETIALISPKTTINIIRNYEVVEKFRVETPRSVVGLVRCGNPNCISNTNEPLESRFFVESEDPVRLRCSYCEFVLETELAEHLL
ncbi:aspartate carbamoyltransferase regulatory subunit [Methanocella sp. CWC-04]|uniref:Aspartate carbamoyltransferase regulatory chain n=1 Tax=Methanooceanicella nereidis TaxID=2052831 RepID=A0AAP2W5B9_9EURY|nr:aspartate carbamoyltransferase regulatory subunit [Methanocella sp. CWC-04]MCD1295320.1 aspartate carbamoyltransferase regulatory subunit [Methanocella sp. CWC-04]